MTNKNKSRLMGLAILIPVIILMLIGSSCSSKQEIKAYSTLEGKWKFDFIQTDTISGIFQILKADNQYFTSGATIEKGDLYVALGEVTLGKNLIISNSEKYLLTDTITIYSLTPNFAILTLNKIKSNNNTTISCNSQSLYHSRWKQYTNQLIIKRY